MAKRQALQFDPQELTDSLKQSTGKGIDAFFPSHAPQRNPTPAPSTRSQGPVVPRSQGTNSPRTQGTRTADPSSPSSPYRANFAQPAGKELKIRVSWEEYEALVDWKTMLRRHGAVETSFQDLIRCALELAADDYQTAGTEGKLIRLLKRAASKLAAK